MADFVDSLLELPVADLKRRMTQKGKSRGSYDRIERSEYSRSELVEYVREHDVRSVRQLLDCRSEKDPKPHDYIKEFGSWSDAKEYIWRDSDAEFTRKYVVQAVVEFGLWTMQDYEEARKNRPDVLPSMYFIKKEFGGWSVMKKVAKAYSMREILAAYVELKRKLGKMPTLEDCRREGVEIGKAVEILGGKYRLDEFVNMMEILS